MDIVLLNSSAMCGLSVNIEFGLNPNQEQSPLFVLPIELRASIYEYFFFSTETKIVEREFNS